MIVSAPFLPCPRPCCGLAASPLPALAPANSAPTGGPAPPLFGSTQLPPAFQIWCGGCSLSAAGAVLLPPQQLHHGTTSILLPHPPAMARLHGVGCRLPVLVPPEGSRSIMSIPLPAGTPVLPRSACRPTSPAPAQTHFGSPRQWCGPAGATPRGTRRSKEQSPAAWRRPAGAPRCPSPSGGRSSVGCPHARDRSSTRRLNARGQSPPWPPARDRSRTMAAYRWRSKPIPFPWFFPRPKPIRRSSAKSVALTAPSSNRPPPHLPHLPLELPDTSSLSAGRPVADRPCFSSAAPRRPLPPPRACAGSSTTDDRGGRRRIKDRDGADGVDVDVSLQPHATNAAGRLLS
ncbi:unnamed protein product [Urochloa humidicola]